MKVLMVTTSHYWGDTRIFHLEAKSLRDLGAEVTILAFDSYKAWHTEEGVNIQTLTGGRNRILRLLSNPVRAFLYCFAHRKEYDVIHFHDPEFLPWGALLSSSKPTIYDMHEFAPDAILTRGWIPPSMRKTVALFVNQVERLCIGRLENVVVINEFGTERAERLGAKRTAVFMGVPRRELAEESGMMQSERSGVLYLGGLSETRGAETIIKAAPELRAMGLSIKVAGVLHDESAKQVQRTDGIDYIGVLKDRNEVARVLRSSAIGWIPLKHTPAHDKGWALKLGEYMAAGLPVVVSDLPYCASVVKKYNCGIVVAADNVEAHIGAIRQLMKDPELALRLGSNGRQAIIDDLNCQGYAGRLVQLYQTIL